MSTTTRKSSTSCDDTKIDNFVNNLKIFYDTCKTNRELDRYTKFVTILRDNLPKDNPLKLKNWDIFISILMDVYIPSGMSARISPSIKVLCNQGAIDIDFLNSQLILNHRNKNNKSSNTLEDPDNLVKAIGVTNNSNALPGTNPSSPVSSRRGSVVNGINNSQQSSLAELPPPPYTHTPTRTNITNSSRPRSLGRKRIVYNTRSISPVYNNVSKIGGTRKHKKRSKKTRRVKRRSH